MKKSKRSKTVTITLNDEDWQSLVTATDAFNKRNHLSVPPTTIAAAAFQLGLTDYYKTPKLDKPVKG